MNNLSSMKKEELEKFIHDCQIDGNHKLANTLCELLARRAAAEKPVAWTDEQELRDVERDGCGYLFTVNPITPHADMRRVIPLFTARRCLLCLMDLHWCRLMQLWTCSRKAPNKI